MLTFWRYSWKVIHILAIVLTITMGKEKVDSFSFKIFFLGHLGIKKKNKEAEEEENVEQRNILHSTRRGKKSKFFFYSIDNS